MKQWFSRETKRLYAHLASTIVMDEVEKVIEAVKRLGGRATPRDLHKRGQAQFSNVANAEVAMQKVVDAKRGKWENPKPGKKGGRPKNKLFVLI